MKQYKAVLLDINGTLHIEHQAIPNAVTAVHKLLHSPHIHTAFVSNTTKHSRQTMLKQATQLGFEINNDRLYTSLTTTAQLFRPDQTYSKHRRPYLLLNDDAAEEFYAVSGCEKVSGEQADKYDAVVIGLSPQSFNYNQLNIAFRILQASPDHAFIATHAGRYHQTSDGLSLGPGAMMAALEYATGRKADVIGKPTQTFYSSVLQSLGVQASEAVMIGDDLRDDVIGAIKCGIDGVLVRTGKYTKGDENKYDVKPTHTFDNVSHAVNAILQAHQDGGKQPSKL